METKQCTCVQNSVFLNTDRGFIRAIIGELREVEFTQDVRFAKTMPEDIAEGLAEAMLSKGQIKHFALLAAVNVSPCLPPFDVGDHVVDLDGNQLEVELVDCNKRNILARREDNHAKREVVGFDEAIHQRHWRKAA